MQGVVSKISETWRVDFIHLYGFMYNMKTTLDLSDDLYALVKAKAALEGRTLRSVVEELLQGWVGAGISNSILNKDSTPLLSEPKVTYGKKRTAKKSAPTAPWDILRKKWEKENDPNAPISTIAGTIKNPGPDLDMAKAREIYERHLAEEWKRRYP